jgi:hypothetical protein
MGRPHLLYVSIPHSTKPMENNFELAEPPTDGISAVSFSPSAPNFLLVASWDRVTIWNQNRPLFQVLTLFRYSNPTHR